MCVCFYNIYVFIYILQKLILSETSIFDVLPNFFYHSNRVVCMAALEVSGFFCVFCNTCGSERTPPPTTPRPLSSGILAHQVYVRRAYIAYELNSLQHHQLQGGTCALDFQFMLPSSHPNRYHSCSFQALHSQYLPELVPLGDDSPLCVRQQRIGGGAELKEWILAAVFSGWFGGNWKHQEG